MIKQSSSRLRLATIKAGFNNWRVVFLFFAIVYAFFLIFKLSNMPIVWDEAVHLRGATLLTQGSYGKFVNGAFYPPLFDLVASVFFNTFGVSLFVGRLVSAIFCLLTLWVVFEFAYSMYGGKVAILSAVLLGIMPGYFWLSRLALLDVMLTFFVVLSFFFFFLWIKNQQNKMLVFSGLALGFGFLTKYEMLAALVVMIVSLVFMQWGQLKRFFLRFTFLFISAVIVVTPWLVIVYQVYASQILSRWVYAMNIGNPARLLYSDRFPLPIFYLIDMTWPYNGIHPISVLLYVVGLLGLGLFVWRRHLEDKFVFIWFAVIFAFFTLIGNKEWRYVLPLFPTLAISASVFVFFFYSKMQNIWKKQISINRTRIAKVFACLFALFLVVAMVYSINDAYYGVKINNIQIDIPAATNYVIHHDNGSQAVMVLCPFNFFSKDMVNFYLWADGIKGIPTYQYPQLPVDAYTPTFNITQFITLCKQNNVKYVLTYEYGGTVPYFNTTLNLQQIYKQLYTSGNFTKICPQETFGSDPRRIFILNFTG